MSLLLTQTGQCSSEIGEWAKRSREILAGGCVGWRLLLDRFGVLVKVLTSSCCFLVWECLIRGGETKMLGHWVGNVLPSVAPNT